MMHKVAVPALRSKPNPQQQLQPRGRGGTCPHLRLRSVLTLMLCVVGVLLLTAVYHHHQRFKIIVGRLQQQHQHQQGQQTPLYQDHLYQDDTVDTRRNEDQPLPKVSKKMSFLTPTSAAAAPSLTLKRDGIRHHQVVPPTQKQWQTIKGQISDNVVAVETKRVDDVTLDVPPAWIAIRPHYALGTAEATARLLGRQSVRLYSSSSSSTSSYSDSSSSSSQSSFRIQAQIAMSPFPNGVMEQLIFLPKNSNRQQSAANRTTIGQHSDDDLPVLVRGPFSVRAPPQKATTARGVNLHVELVVCASTTETQTEKMRGDKNNNELKEAAFGTRQNLLRTQKHLQLVDTFFSSGAAAALAEDFTGDLRTLLEGSVEKSVTKHFAAKRDESDVIRSEENSITSLSFSIKRQIPPAAAASENTNQRRCDVHVESRAFSRFEIAQSLRDLGPDEAGQHLHNSLPPENSRWPEAYFAYDPIIVAELADEAYSLKASVSSSSSLSSSTYSEKNETGHFEKNYTVLHSRQVVERDGSFHPVVHIAAQHVAGISNGLRTWFQTIITTTRSFHTSLHALDVAVPGGQEFSSSSRNKGKAIRDEHDKNVGVFSTSPSPGPVAFLSTGNATLDSLFYDSLVTLSDRQPLQRQQHQRHLFLNSDVLAKVIESFVFAPCLSISLDVPKLPWRGQHVDIARHFVPFSTLTGVILRNMAKHKMNRLHLHLADDQGWRVESKQFPSLHRVGSVRGESLNGARMRKYHGLPYHNDDEMSDDNSSSVIHRNGINDSIHHETTTSTLSSANYSNNGRYYFTLEEIRALCRFAARRGIIVVPEVDLPAHAGALVRAINEERRLQQLQQREGRLRDSSSSNSSLNKMGVKATQQKTGNKLFSPPRAPAPPVIRHAIGETVRVPGEGNEDCAWPATEARTADYLARPQAINCMGGSFGIVHPSRSAEAVIKALVDELWTEGFGAAAAPFDTTPAATTERARSSNLIQQQQGTGAFNMENASLLSAIPQSAALAFHLGGDQAQFIRSNVWGPYLAERLKAAAATTLSVPSSSSSSPLVDGLDETRILQHFREYAAATSSASDTQSLQELLGTLQAHAVDRMISHVSHRRKGSTTNGGNIRQQEEELNHHNNENIGSNHGRKKKWAVLWDDSVMDLNATYVPPAAKTMFMLWRSDGINLPAMRLRLAAMHNLRRDEETTISAARGAGTAGAPIYPRTNDLSYLIRPLEGRQLASASPSSSSPVDGPVILPRIILTPKTHAYFDYVQFEPLSRNRFVPMQIPAPWVGYKAITLRKTFELHALIDERPSASIAFRGQQQQRHDNAASFASQFPPLVYGVQGCIWTELMPTEDILRYQLFPRMFAVADAGWSRRAVTDNPYWTSIKRQKGERKPQPSVEANIRHFLQTHAEKKQSSSKNNQHRNNTDPIVVDEFSTPEQLLGALYTRLSGSGGQEGSMGRGGGEAAIPPDEAALIQLVEDDAHGIVAGHALAKAGPSGIAKDEFDAFHRALLQNI